ncbi:MAG TPA: tetratricopeptide repeat protein [Gemmatimonadales bacterium]|nr:tetratricopeptide repeat protein [Gemmatimonadales bacterium]
MSRWSRAAALLLVGVGCTRSAADHEVLGDREYAAGQYRDALAEYELGLRATAGSAALHAKTAAAALHVGEYTLAVAEYRVLAEADKSRADEAADGLERVASAALQAGDHTALGAALSGLRVVAPNRPLGRYARLVALDAAAAGDVNDALAYLPTAIATSSDARTADSLLFLYGNAALGAHDCNTAVVVFEGVLRRQRQGAVLDAAREGLARCALVRGQEALNAGRAAEAEDWFRRAATPGATVDVARAAALGLGDVQLSRGDVAGAVEQYQQAMVGGLPGDSLSLRARQKLEALGRADSLPPANPQ